MARLRALLEAWLDYSRGREFPGGCFFSRATHEYAARPGPVRDALAEADQEWLVLVATTIDEARELGEVRADVDSRQLAYELDAYLDSANMRSLLAGDPAVYDLARAAFDGATRLRRRVEPRRTDGERAAGPERRGSAKRRPMSRCVSPSGCRLSGSGSVVVVRRAVQRQPVEVVDRRVGLGALGRRSGRAPHGSPAA